MVFQPMNFQTPTLPVMDPYGEGQNLSQKTRYTGALATDVENRNRPENLHEQLLAAQLANQLNQIKAKYAEPKEQQALLASRLANQSAQAILPYAGPKAQADLYNKQAQLPLTQAQTKLTQENARLAPLKSLIAAQNSSRSSSRFGQAYQLSRALSNMDPASKAEWIQENSGPYQEMLTNLANTSGQQNTISPEVMQEYFPEIKNNNSPSNTNSNAQFKPPTPENTEKLQDLLSLQANKKATSAGFNNRAESAVAFHKFLMDNQEKYGKAIANVAKYAGAAGKAKLGWDSIKKESPEAYKDYLWFKSAFTSNVINQVKQMEKMGATDTQREELRDMLERGISKIDTDPKSAIALINRAIKTMGDVGSAVISAAEPVNKGAYKKSFGLKDIPENYISSNQEEAYENKTPGNKSNKLVTVVMPDGNHWTIPSEKLEAAKARGGKEVN